MTRVEISKSEGDRGPRVEIRIHPQKFGMVFAGAAICGGWVWLTSQGQIRVALLMTALAPLAALLGWSARPPDRATLEGGYIDLQKQFFGIKSSMKFQLGGISNLRYLPKRRYGDAYAPQPSILFAASEELGLDQGFGMGLKEQEAQEIIRCIEEYRVQAGAAGAG